MRNVTIPLKGPVVKDPSILSGTPVIKGTRIPASLLFELFSRGYTTQIILKEYPSLSQNKLEAFLKLMASSFSNGSAQKAI